MAGIDCRYANIARRSASVISLYMGHGIGGRMSRPSPRCLPVRSALTKISGVQLPRPVALSGVRLGAKLTPQPPTQAVRLLLVRAPHLFGAMSPAGTGFNFSFAGCPDKSRFWSGSAVGVF